jgi:hypothetical protein
MKTRLYAAAVAALLLACAVPFSEARAGGVGFYLSVGGGDAETKRDSPFGTIRDDEKSDHAGFGFAFDTNLLQPNKLFNYRMNLGYERLKFEVDDPASINDGVETDTRGFAIEQDFGFGGKIAPNVRIWGGPSLRLSYHHGDDDFRNDHKFWGIGVGPVLGVNIGTGGPAVFSIKGGYLVNGYGGRWNRTAGGEYDFSANEDYFFINFSTLFKTGN